ncbi:MAG: oligoendopeptidase F [Verrucomicrobia bacterium]|nr:oligoendopeptidase F [Verrucomicrobiota bacterium]
MNRLHPLLPVAALLSAGMAFAAPTSAPDIPDYSQTPRSKVPDGFKFNLTDLFKDADAWRAELRQADALLAKLDAAAKDWTSSATKMADTLDLISTLNERGDRLYAYAKLQNDMDLSDPQFTGMIGEIQAQEVKLNTASAFLAPGLLALGDEKVAAYLKAEPRLAPYRFSLEKILRNRSHTLSEAEESIVAQMGLFADTPVKVSNLLNDVDMPPAEVTLSDGTKVALTESNFLRHRISPVAADRRTVVEAYWKNVLKYENTFAALLDGEMRKQVALARIYKFPTCLEANLFENNIKPEVYHNLIATVRGNTAPLHRLLRLKQKMLGLSELNYYDVAVPAAPAVRQLYSLDDARHHVISATAPLGEEYAKRLRQAFDGRWVDYYPNKGKQGGAYSLGVYGMHPFVKMNYTGRFDEVSTLAHELGHSMHSVFSNENQPFPTARYSIFIAEIASTFNETLLIKEVLKTTKDDQVKLQLLENFLERMRGTIYAQTMLAEFELAMHERAEKGQALTAEWLKTTFAETYHHYMGVDQGVVKFDDSLAVSWASVPHFYRPFYVFQYATGMVAATALADAVLTEGKPARDRYLGLLSAGGSKFPLDLLRDAGIDMSKPEPIKAALKQFDDMVSEMEAIYERLPAEAKKGTSR